MRRLRRTPRLGRNPRRLLHRRRRAHRLRRGLPRTRRLRRGLPRTRRLLPGLRRTRRLLRQPARREAQEHDRKRGRFGSVLHRGPLSAGPPEPDIGARQGRERRSARRSPPPARAR
ncbi:Hypothetical protein A7982_05258 [Minicystis rosea]|nr:Hypothetical protein A7982_05258 [Minicystis rosea]